MGCRDVAGKLLEGLWQRFQQPPHNLFWVATTFHGLWQPSYNQLATLC